MKEKTLIKMTNTEKTEIMEAVEMNDATNEQEQSRKRKS